MKMDERVFDDLGGLSRAALAELQRIAKEAVRDHGRFAVAFSGGRTPAKLYSLWAQTDADAAGAPWDRVHIFWGDERYVPHDDLLSNYRMAREALLSRAPIPAENIHPMPTDCAAPDDCAAAYEAAMREYFGSAPPAFDLQLLGLGPDGHTASLFPGSPALEEKVRWVAAVEAAANPRERLTLTPVVLNEARNTFFLVSGADKRQIVQALRREEERHRDASEYPAARIRPAGQAAWFLDRAAAV
ncbi:MAG: 6-phosphogluconolactonase [Acidobacteriota bacterium]|nr:6-phosphogluconolactonase [Acidobacteriota bacterium]MDE3170886.1 6-phosphogluconolactonase [Acidobacteriota bacterium]